MQWDDVVVGVFVGGVCAGLFVLAWVPDWLDYVAALGPLVVLAILMAVAVVLTALALHGRRRERR